jgi:phage terminase large subunit GpA-like protein
MTDEPSDPLNEVTHAFWNAIKFHPHIPLPDWVEQNIHLSARACPTPGPMRLWKPQRGILQAIDDRDITYVSVMKAARLGYTKTIMASLGHYAANDPSSVLLVLPTEDDCNRVSRDEVAPMFAESPTLADLLSTRQGPGDRDSLTAKYFTKGGSLKIIASRSPRNLRSHDARIVYMDEIDAFETTEEGSPIELVINRTLAHPDRKIIMGSTPTIEGQSEIQRQYDQSDKRVFEVPCPHCSTPFELLWEHIEWPPDNPWDAYAVCPHCGSVIEESFKEQMVEAGEWRTTAPEVRGHAGFRMNVLISLFINAKWGNIVEKYLNAKHGGPDFMRPFENTQLGKCSTLAIDSIDARVLASRGEDFSLHKLPTEVLVMACGGDVQGDRIEIVFLGFGLDGAQFVLGHVVLMGNTSEDSVWKSLDALLAQRFRHPSGYDLLIEAVAIDSGYRSQKVYDFTQPRHHRHIYAIKGRIGAPGGRNAIWTPGFSKTSRAIKLYFVSVDQAKTLVLERLAALPFLNAAGEPCREDEGCGRNPAAFRFSNELEEQFYEQCANERRNVDWIHNRPKIVFHPVFAGARTEALDCLVYATAVRHSCTYINLRTMARKLDTTKPPRAHAAPAPRPADPAAPPGVTRVNLGPDAPVAKDPRKSMGAQFAELQSGVRQHPEPPIQNKKKHTWDDFGKL